MTRWWMSYLSSKAQKALRTNHVLTQVWSEIRSAKTSVCLFILFNRIIRITFCAFFRSVFTMFVHGSSGWHTWRDSLGMSSGCWVSLGPVWSGKRYRQNLGLFAVPLWPTHSCWQTHWLVTHGSVCTMHYWSHKVRFIVAATILRTFSKLRCTVLTWCVCCQVKSFGSSLNPPVCTALCLFLVFPIWTATKSAMWLWWLLITHR